MMNVPWQLIFLIFILNATINDSRKTCKRKYNFCKNSICKCPEGLKANKKNTCCVDICKQKCIGGKCIGRNQCKCKSGYIATEIPNVCEPFCSNCTDGYCYDHEKCAKSHLKIKLLDGLDASLARNNILDEQDHTKTLFKISWEESKTTARYSEESTDNSLSTRNTNNFVELSFSDKFQMDTLSENGSTLQDETVSSSPEPIVGDEVAHQSPSVTMPPAKPTEGEYQIADETPFENDENISLQEKIILNYPYLGYYHNLEDKQNLGDVVAHQIPTVLPHVEPTEGTAFLVSHLKQPITETNVDTHKYISNELRMAAVPLGFGLLIGVVVVALLVGNRYRNEQNYTLM